MFTFNGRIKRKNIVTSKLTREDWLNKSAFFINRDIFSKKGYDLDLKNIKISVGNTQRSTGVKHTVLGVCYSKRVSTGNFNEIVLSWAVDDSKEALGTLVHELVHCFNIDLLFKNIDIEFEAKEYFMREYKKITEKYESSLKAGARMIATPGPYAVR